MLKKLHNSSNIMFIQSLCMNIICYNGSSSLENETTVTSIHYTLTSISHGVKIDTGDMHMRYLRIY